MSKLFFCKDYVVDALIKGGKVIVGPAADLSVAFLFEKTSIRVLMALHCRLRAIPRM